MMIHHSSGTEQRSAAENRRPVGQSGSWNEFGRNPVAASGGTVVELGR